MSNSIMKDIYYGRRGSAENISVSEEYYKTLKKIIEKEDALIEQLSSEQKKLYKEIENLYGELQSEDGLTQYKEGLKIGLRVAFECFDEE